LNYLAKGYKNPPVSNILKIRPVGDKIFHTEKRADGLTDTMKLVVPFRSFAKAP